MEIIEDIRQLPELREDIIHIWGIKVPAMHDRQPLLKSVLCSAELEKSDRYHREQDRHSSIAARGALRILLSGYSGIPASEIEFHYSKNGKPSMSKSDLAFNVSHSGEWVVLAIGLDRSIGIDIEQIKRTMDVMAIASRYFMAEEQSVIEKAEDQYAAFFHFWSRKEAYIKARGSTLFRELSTFSVPFKDEEKDGWVFQSLKAGSTYAAAVVTDKPIAEMPCFDFGGLKWDN